MQCNMLNLYGEPCTQPVVCSYQITGDLWGYRCEMHQASIPDGLVVVPVIDIPTFLDDVRFGKESSGMTNLKSDNISYGRYILIRCEVIRARYQNRQITFEEARAGVTASLDAIGAIGIDQVDPITWLRK